MAMSARESGGGPATTSKRVGQGCRRAHTPPKESPAGPAPPCPVARNSMSSRKAITTTDSVCEGIRIVGRDVAKQWWGAVGDDEVRGSRSLQNRRTLNGWIRWARASHHRRKLTDATLCHHPSLSPPSPPTHAACTSPSMHSLFFCPRANPAGPPRFASSRCPGPVVANLTAAVRSERRRRIWTRTSAARPGGLRRGLTVVGVAFEGRLWVDG